MTINKSWYVYVVRCSKGALYTGVSLDIKRRIREHNSGKGSKAVRALGLPVSLVLISSQSMSKSKALKLEAWFKKLSKAQKEYIIWSSK
jgi:putative endonuclease